MNLPKFALGAWAWGNDGTFGVTKSKHLLDAKVASEINLTQEKIKYLEEVADKLEISTIRM